MILKFRFNFLAIFVRFHMLIGLGLLVPLLLELVDLVGQLDRDPRASVALGPAILGLVEDGRGAIFGELFHKSGKS